MSISCLLIVVSVASAVEFDVGAGFEGVGFARGSTLDGGLAQAELDARLVVGAVGLRLDLDLLGPGPFGDDERTGSGGLAFSPEWAAATLHLGGGWRLAAGFQPLPVFSEQVDGWANPLVPYSHGFTELWGGNMLGLRGQVSALEGRLLSSVWGGARSEGPQAPGAPLIGGGLALAEGQGVSAKVTATYVFTEAALLGGAGVSVPLGDLAELAFDGSVGLGSGAKGALSGTVTFLPDGSLSPAMRAEATWGLASPWVVDAGLAWRVHPSLRMAFSGRVDDGQPWIFLGVSLMDDVLPGREAGLM